MDSKLTTYDAPPQRVRKIAKFLRIGFLLRQVH